MTIAFTIYEDLVNHSICCDGRHWGLWVLHPHIQNWIQVIKPINLGYGWCIPVIDKTKFLEIGTILVETEFDLKLPTYSRTS